jgi:ATP phosphoribosyltransferase regulatory subunit
MVYQPPSGARDLLPIDVVQKCWIENGLQQVLDRWGYHRIITSTLERMDTLMAGGAIEARQILQIRTGADEALGLRPELTASIARTAVTRMAGSTQPTRLYYNANVFRRPEEGSRTTQPESYQAGVELLGAGGLLADAEILLLVMDCLKGIGLSNRWQLVLGDAGLTRSLLWEFPKPLRDKVRRAIAHLDRTALETLPMESDLRDRALLLLELRGSPQSVFDRLNQMALDDYQQQAATNLKQLVDLLQETAGQGSGQAALPIVLDLSLIRTFDYYTGIVFEVVSDPAAGQHILGQGGRYDELLGVYHPQGESIPGIGFSFEIERLHQALLPIGQLPTHIPVIDGVVVPEARSVYPVALVEAQRLRDAGARVEVYLMGTLIDGTAIDRSTIRAELRERAIGEIVWVMENGEMEVERL